MTTTVDNHGEKKGSVLPAILIGAAAVAAIGALAVIIVKKRKTI